jgi:hypothetical protein
MNNSNDTGRTLVDIEADIELAEKAVAKAASLKKTRRGIELHTRNPYIGEASANTNQGTRRKALKGKDGTQLILTTEGGDMVAPAGFWQLQEVDKTQFVKLYVNGVKALSDLSSAGTKVFELLYLEIQAAIGRDKVYLSFAALDPECGVTQSTFTRGIRELLDKKFIAATTSVGWYFLNPDYLFNGDRLAFVKEFRIKRDAESDQIYKVA